MLAPKIKKKRQPWKQNRHGKPLASFCRKKTEVAPIITPKPNAAPISPIACVRCSTSEWSAIRACAAGKIHPLNKDWIIRIGRRVKNRVKSVHRHLKLAAITIAVVKNDTGTWKTTNKNKFSPGRFGGNAPKKCCNNAEQGGSPKQCNVPVCHGIKPRSLPKDGSASNKKIGPQRAPSSPITVAKLFLIMNSCCSSKLDLCTYTIATPITGDAGKNCLLKTILAHAKGRTYIIFVEEIFDITENVKAIILKTEPNIREPVIVKCQAIWRINRTAFQYRSI